jgi:hypothetical protein
MAYGISFEHVWSLYACSRQMSSAVCTTFKSVSSRSKTIPIIFCSMQAIVIILTGFCVLRLSVAVRLNASLEANYYINVLRTRY